PVPPGSIRPQGGIPSRGSCRSHLAFWVHCTTICRGVKYFGCCFFPRSGPDLPCLRPPLESARCPGILYVNRPPDAFRSPRRGRASIETYMSWCPIISAPAASKAVVFGQTRPSNLTRHHFFSLRLDIGQTPSIIEIERHGRRQHS